MEVTMTVEARNVLVQTLNFGALEVAEERILFFKEGIPGFPHAQRFALIEPEDTKPFQYLQSLGEPPVALLVIDPFLIDPDYKVKISQNDMEEIGAASLEDLAVSAIATIPNDPAGATLNLMAPIVYNPSTRRGKQLILHESGYSVRQPLVAASRG
jgi:flagellar assembly factor FliW